MSDILRQKADNLLALREDMYEMHFYRADREWLIDAMVDFAMNNSKEISKKANKHRVKEVKKNKSVTAVEWLANQIYEKMNMSGDGEVLDELLKQAKKIEKKKRIDAQMDMFYHLNEIPYGMAYLAKRNSAEKFCKTYKFKD